MFTPPPPKAGRCRVLYVSPLKALAVDVERNLRAPLAGIAQVAAGRGDAFLTPAIAIRTGDTPQTERARFQREPADILITTPESLYLLLTSNAREALRSIDTIIIDEIHALVPTKRGAHLALSLERLEALCARPPQRIGLSATQRPLDEVARFLGGVRAPRSGRSARSPRSRQRTRTPQGDAEIDARIRRSLAARSVTGPSPSSTPARRRRSSSPSKCRSRTWRSSAPPDDIPSGPAGARDIASRRSGRRSTRACSS